MCGSILDDWFGMDPPPPPPKAERPAPPAPTRRQPTDNVLTGVDASRRAVGEAGSTGSITKRRTTAGATFGQDVGVGLNV